MSSRCPQVVKRRVVVMLCRMGLMSVLLVWSRWGRDWPRSWLLLSLPLADALLSILPLYCPQVLKGRAYPYAVRGTHRLYGLTLGMLLLTGLWGQRTRYTVWGIAGCVQSADGAWAKGEIEADGTWRLEMAGHFIWRWKPRNAFEQRVLLILFRQIRTPESTPQRPFLRQEWLAAWFKTCLNPSCSFGTFTNYPDQVRLYSEWTVDAVLWGVMVYMHLRTTYRRAADVVGVSSVTLWRWTMVVGEQTLPLAQLFGLVRSSGVIGVEEKWVLVPKNDKPEGKRKRWMYVYLAVDVYPYDLLHIDIYPRNGKNEARAFLQALKAKGYQPQVITPI